MPEWCDELKLLIFNIGRDTRLCHYWRRAVGNPYLSQKECILKGQFVYSKECIFIFFFTPEFQLLILLNILLDYFTFLPKSSPMSSLFGALATTIGRINVETPEYQVTSTHEEANFPFEIRQYSSSVAVQVLIEQCETCQI